MTLDEIEWYGQDVGQLDPGHVGKVVLTGQAAALLAARSVLISV
ncbi:hypothetical protein ABZ858_28245 [Streptomyces sp. NPDC047017]